VTRIPTRSWELAQRPPHVATTVHLRAAYPFLAEPGLGGHGVYIGRDAYGAAFAFDPFELYERGLISGPNVVVAGSIGYGKSSLVKSFMARSTLFARRPIFLDPKGEYAPLAEAMGWSVVALQPGGSARLNPLTSRGGAEGQLQALAAVTAAAIGRTLTPEEDAACTEALRAVCDREPGGEPTLPDVVEALLHPSSDVAQRMAMEVDQLVDATRSAALALARLCEGALAGMFDGPTTTGVDLDGPGLVLDLSAMYDSAALGILMACAQGWLRAQIIAAAKSNASVKRYVVVDEAWRIFAVPGVGEWLQDSFKHSRAYGVSNWLVMHKLADMGAAGDTGSRTAKLVEGLLGDSETRILLRQPADVASSTRDALTLTDTETELLPGLRKGEHLWKVGERSFLIRHRLSGWEHRLVDTDSRMRAVA